MSSSVRSRAERPRAGDGPAADTLSCARARMPGEPPRRDRSALRRGAESGRDAHDVAPPTHGSVPSSARRDRAQRPPSSPGSARAARGRASSQPLEPSRRRPGDWPQPRPPTARACAPARQPPRTVRRCAGPARRPRHRARTGRSPGHSRGARTAGCRARAALRRDSPGRPVDGRRALDLARVAALLGAPAVEHVVLVLDRRRIAEAVPDVGVPGDQPQRLLLAAAADQDRDVPRRRRVQPTEPRLDPRQRMARSSSREPLVPNS